MKVFQILKLRNKMQLQFTIDEVSNLLNISIARLQDWIRSGRLIPQSGQTIMDYTFSRSQLESYEPIRRVFETKWDEQMCVTPKRNYSSVELFAGAGGLAIGFEKAGINNVLLNEIDKHACATLRYNRPKWNVVEDAIENVDFSQYANKVDVVTGGFPCQAFSYAGKKRGFEDTRGTLFYEFTRCVKEVNPKIFVAENVKGLLSHDGGKTLETIIMTFEELGYKVVTPKVLQAMYYCVPQKRERLIVVGIRNDYADRIVDFSYPEPYNRVLTVSDAFNKGELYDTDVPKSNSIKYSKKKEDVMKLVPEGGFWRDLPIDIQKEYMGGCFYLGGGKTGLARRLSMKAPSLTIVCAPAMKQTERCHPIETRPLTIRESARIQTFPDDWTFKCSDVQAYKQIGNAVPVNLAYAVARRVVDFLNKIEE
ncbi:MAG: helix-turn-helix domain-containing protein [Rikenellaceae bacterium]